MYIYFYFFYYFLYIYLILDVLGLLSSINDTIIEALLSFFFSAEHLSEWIGMKTVKSTSGNSKLRFTTKE